MKLRAPTARIDAQALRHNLGVVRRHAPDSRVLAMVKADGYGHGALDCARALLIGGADALGVACLGEALQLRQAGIIAQICATQGPHHASELAAFAHHRIHATLHHLWQIEALARWRGEVIPIWLKIDTGMGRFGLAPETLPDVLHQLRNARVRLCGLMTHFACADESGSEHTTAQIARFDAAAAGQDLPHSIANSAALIAWPQTRREWVRPGIMLYGSSPFAPGHPVEQELQPVMQFETSLLSIRQLDAGASIGYGARWQCSEAMPVGLVAAGYADGYPRHAPDGTPVLVNGQRAQLIGRVSMDSLAVDLRGIDAEPGDPVTLWGQGLSVNEVAEASGTISYELLTRVRPNARSPGDSPARG